MPKKAKKGGGRTEEQRLVQQQQRAQAEEEMVKKKEEMLALFLQDKLQKEQRNSAVNLLKLNEHWRTALRQSRCAELREDMDVHMQTFERQLDDMDGSIKKLVCDLQEAERHEARVQRGHRQHLDHLREQQDRHLRRLQQHWDEALQEFNLRIHTEREQRATDREQQQLSLQDLNALVQERNQEKMGTIQKLYNVKLDQYEDDDLATAHLEEMLLKDLSALQCVSESRMMEHVLSANQGAVQRDLRQARKMQDLVTQRNCSIQASQMSRDLVGAREDVSQKFHKLQEHVTRARTMARKQFTRLTIQADAATKKLQAVISKGEKVLQAADMCCRLEGVLSASPLPAERHTAAKVWDDMASLMYRINAAVLLHGALRKQAADLSRENQQLQLLLLQHCGALDGHPNPLYVTPVPTTTTAPAADRGHTIIEAVHVLKYAH